MIGNITSGTHSKPLLKYLLEKEKAKLLCSNMFGNDYQTLAAEFKLSQSLRPDIKQSVYHVSLSLDPKEKLNARAWKEVAQKYLEKMGFKNSQFVAVLHRDRDHDHLHIVTSKIDLDGHVVNSSYDYFRSQTIIRDIEREYLLKQLQSSWECARHQQPRHEIEVLNKTWDNSVRRHLQKTLDEIVDFNNRLTVPQLLKELGSHQISHQVHYADTGAVRGLSYSYNGINYSGTSLGRAYTFPGLQKHRGIVCDSTIEREIYNTCTISPNTAIKTRELLQQQELQQQQRDAKERRAIELELIRREEERIKRSQEKELKRIKLEKERKKQRIAAQNQEIKNLAPVFTPCIEYTHLQGVPISEATAFKALNHIHKTIWNEPVEDGLCVETKNYIITIKANTKNEPILSPNDQLEIGLNCCQLRVERKDTSDEILSINYRDYQNRDVDNIHIVYNQLTSSDYYLLQSLQKPVSRLKQLQQRQLHSQSEFSREQKRLLQLQQQRAEISQKSLEPTLIETEDDRLEKLNTTPEKVLWNKYSSGIAVSTWADLENIANLALDDGCSKATTANFLATAPQLKGEIEKRGFKKVELDVKKQVELAWHKTNHYQQYKQALVAGDVLLLTVRQYGDVIVEGKIQLRSNQDAWEIQYLSRQNTLTLTKPLENKTLLEIKYDRVVHLTDTDLELEILYNLTNKFSSALVEAERERRIEQIERQRQHERERERGYGGFEL
ncbi:MAG: relaxase/mobilization nuclease domain-containing protein [Prochloraceae cyanobacterium]|nr:relaxase/mobilization nuclease domain-containing protein [Prochloraceae cyanobacterium]